MSRMLLKILSTLRFYLRYKLLGIFPLPHTAPLHYKPGLYEVYLLTNKGWYHDWTKLGVTTPQIGGIYPLNQREKQSHLFHLIDEALKLTDNSKKNGIDLFCADGFFSAYALQRGAQYIRGVDTDESSLKQARLIHKLLGLDKFCSFINSDITTYEFEQYTFGICAGGLYHISDPLLLLRRLHQAIAGPLVIQTVYSLANEDPDYFETPAPHLTWGCRFNRGYLLQMIELAGWIVTKSHFGELPANDRPEDRGSAYLLCIPQ